MLIKQPITPSKSIEPYFDFLSADKNKIPDEELDVSQNVQSICSTEATELPMGRGQSLCDTSTRVMAKAKRPSNRIVKIYYASRFR